MKINFYTGSMPPCHIAMKWGAMLIGRVTISAPTETCPPQPAAPTPTPDTRNSGGSARLTGEVKLGLVAGGSLKRGKVSDKSFNFDLAVSLAFLSSLFCVVAALQSIFFIPSHST